MTGEELFTMAQRSAHRSGYQMRASQHTTGAQWYEIAEKERRVWEQVAAEATKRVEDEAITRGSILL